MALIDEFPEAGPQEVWRSEEIRGYDQGGYGSVGCYDLTAR